MPSGAHPRTRRRASALPGSIPEAAERLRSFEPAEQLAQQPVEAPPLCGPEWQQQAFLVGDVIHECAIDGGATLARQPHERAATVLGVGPALDQGGLDQPVEPLGDAARRQHRRLHQFGRLHLERPPAAAQRREQIEPTRAEPVLGRSRGEGPVGEVHGAEEPTEQRRRRNVEVRALPPPLRNDAIDVVGFVRW